MLLMCTSLVTTPLLVFVFDGGCLLHVFATVVFAKAAAAAAVTVTARCTTLPRVGVHRCGCLWLLATSTAASLLLQTPFCCAGGRELLVAANTLCYAAVFCTPVSVNAASPSLFAPDVFFCRCSCCNHHRRVANMDIYYVPPIADFFCAGVARVDKTRGRSLSGRLPCHYLSLALLPLLCSVVAPPDVVC